MDCELWPPLPVLVILSVVLYLQIYSILLQFWSIYLLNVKFWSVRNMQFFVVVLLSTTCEFCVFVLVPYFILDLGSLKKVIPNALSSHFVASGRGESL